MGLNSEIDREKIETSRQANNDCKKNKKEINKERKEEEQTKRDQW